MGRASKTASKKKRQEQKRARKASRKALYESYRDRGVNSKSKRARQNAKARKSVRPRTHPYGQCGNPGCIRCFGIRFKPFLVRGEPRGMPHWMWLRWCQLSKDERKAAAA